MAISPGVVPVVPVPLFQACVVDIEKYWTFLQTSLFLAYGKHLIDPHPIPPIEPPVRSSRRRSFRTRRCANTTRQAVVSRGKCPEYSRRGWQGRSDILLGHSFVSFRGRGFVLRGEGKTFVQTLDFTLADR